MSKGADIHTMVRIIQFIVVRQKTWKCEGRLRLTNPSYFKRVPRIIPVVLWCIEGIKGELRAFS